MIRRALLSVSDKTGLMDLARVLAGFNVELISTGGTRKAIAEAGIPVKDISEVTGFPEMLDGRVKTLHPKIHGGLLARRDLPEHMAKIAEHDIHAIDLVVCNLYPFEQTVAKPGVHDEEVIENIDIGGPSMLRSAAKNFAAVAVLTSPSQYAEVIEELQKSGGTLTLETRRRLAKEVFERTSAYDAAIANYFGKTSEEKELPARFSVTLARKSPLRYGENPHQPAAFYAEQPPRPDTVAGAEVLHGKELSFNNLLDLDSALNLVKEFTEPGAVVVKHNNPCGAAIASTLADAFLNAYAGDPTSAFGGILAFNRPVDAATAEKLAEPGKFVECIIAPDFDPAAFEILTTKPTWKKNVRLLKTGPFTVASGKALDFRRVDGGLLVQARDAGADDPSKWVVKTKRQPTTAELEALWFAWRVCKHVKSNAIVLANGSMVVGVGAGQMSRVDSTQISIRKAGERVKGAVLASDAFFPFRDNVDSAAEAGVVAFVQPGGSQRDAESIAACDERGLTMLFTGVRHFRH
nr:bifunctional phosphoribosylaminoimidazolecarboxamide formyltransferase/IMP cyclohydrolase [Zavarzinella formosa]